MNPETPLSDPLKIAVGYLRCSTTEQGGEGGSIEQQREELLRWSEKNHYRIVTWYEDESSGVTFDRRPGFQQLARTVESNPDFRFILVYDESRWGRPRDPRENTYWKVHFERSRVKVVVINSSSARGNSIGDVVVEALESCESAEYSKKLSRAVLRGARRMHGKDIGVAVLHPTDSKDKL